MKWYSATLAALGPIFCCGTQALAQEAAKADAGEGSGTLTTLVLLAPVVLGMFFIISVMTKAKKATADVGRSLQMMEEMIALVREQVTLQRETNRLLAQRIDASSSH